MTSSMLLTVVPRDREKKAPDVLFCATDKRLSLKRQGY